VEAARGHELTLAGFFTFASITFQKLKAFGGDLNTVVVLTTSIAGLIVILPRAVQTIKNTDWKKLFSRER
jgi:hypothetical protein